MAGSTKSDTDLFWETHAAKSKPSQLERYVAAGAPESICKFIALGGGPKMGTTCEEYARYKLKGLKKRSSGKSETGYDHQLLLPIKTKPIYLEQKSSGLWGENEFKWQHVEPGHKWHALLLCGIGFKEIKFWFMSRETYNMLREADKITNQGNKAGESSEGTWFNYSDVKEHLIEVKSYKDLAAAAALIPLD